MIKELYYILFLIIIQFILFLYSTHSIENFQNKGFIRSSKFPNYFIKRLAHGVKTSKKGFDTNYMWIHDDDGKLKSQNNNNKCMNIKGNKPSLQDCTYSGEWKYVGETGQIKYSKKIKE